MRKFAEQSTSDVIIDLIEDFLYQMKREILTRPEAGSSTTRSVSAEILRTP